MTETLTRKDNPVQLFFRNDEYFVEIPANPGVCLQQNLNLAQLCNLRFACDMAIARLQKEGRYSPVVKLKSGWFDKLCNPRDLAHNKNL